jgi:hypothetical protein
MSEQGDAFVRRVLKGDPTPTTFGDAVAYLRQLGGSGRGAARLAGVNEKSFRRWASGTRPKPETQQRILSAYRDLRSKPSKMGDAGVMIPVVSEDRKRGSRERDVSGKQLRLQAGTLAAAHQIWVTTGDADAAARRFVAGIGDEWYRVNLGKAMVPDEDEIPGEADHDIGDDYAMSIG